MKKKFLTVLLTLITALCLCLFFAACDKESDGGQTNNDKPLLPEEGYDENGLYFGLNDDGESYSVYQGEFEGASVVIPSIFNGAPVTSIGRYAFYNCSSLSSITIPDSVTSIGSSAFYGTAYYDDQSHWDASGVLYVGNHLIEAKDTIKGSYTIRTNTKTIADHAFSGCSGLTSITIPDGVTSIGSYAFYICSSLTCITIPDGVTSIGVEAFYSCRSLASITIPDSVTSIGVWAFGYCSGLTGVYITDLSVWCRIDFGNYDSNPLNYAHHLYVDHVELKELTIPNEITEIKPYAFRGCSSLESVMIGSGVTSIGDDAFMGCSGLTSITIPDGVTSIGDQAFRGCSGLTNITLPDSVTSIESYTFYNCSSLTDIHYKGSHEEWLQIEKNNVSIPYQAVIHCTDGDYDTNGNKIQ